MIGLIVLFVGLAAITVVAFAGALGKKAPLPNPFIQTLKMVGELQAITPVPDDPTDDGIEVIIIRSESMYAQDEVLFWRDPATNEVLPYPMDLYAIMNRG